MSLSINRRDFLRSSATVAAAPIGLSSVASAARLFDAETGANVGTADNDLLRTIGQRIGFDAAQRVAPNGEAVSLMYFDYAGPTVDALREGMAQAMTLHSSGKAAVYEIDVPYGELLGVALVRNLQTAAETRIEIDATMLSHLALIEATSSNKLLQHGSIMSAASDCFYRTADLVA
jgi:hypothetical protein